MLSFTVNFENHHVIYSIVFRVNAEKFRSDLMKIAMTTLCSKILSQDKEHFAEMAVDAVFRLKVPSLPPFKLNLQCIHSFSFSGIYMLFHERKQFSFAICVILDCP